MPAARYAIPGLMPVPSPIATAQADLLTEGLVKFDVWTQPSDEKSPYFLCQVMEVDKTVINEQVVARADGWVSLVDDDGNVLTDESDFILQVPVAEGEEDTAPDDPASTIFRSFAALGFEPLSNSVLLMGPDRNLSLPDRTAWIYPHVSGAARTYRFLAKFGPGNWWVKITAIGGEGLGQILTQKLVVVSYDRLAV